MKNSTASGIILYAKRPGMTSFSSLGLIKKALQTGKVGHTGTLDSFAEGLLVVLVGKLTKLVPHITSADKTYQAVISFGKETDTLELSGEVIKTAPIPSKKQILEILSQFIGNIQQIPPLYSALHIDGKRASDIARSGKEVEMPSRPVTINSLEMLDYSEEDGIGLFQICCSKGTYIRSLARDIAKAAGSCAYLVALRRIKVGSFSLDDAVFESSLGDFNIDSRGCTEQKGEPYTEKNLQLVRDNLQPLTPQIAAVCGLKACTLISKYSSDFFIGKPLRKKWFDSFLTEGENAVFTEDGYFAGIVKYSEQRLKYGFVIKPGDE